MPSEEVECLECRFCHGLVGTEAGEVRKLERHLVDTHDILFNKQLSLATFFITTEEVATILASIEPRINLFKTEGVLDLQTNVFADKKEKDETEAPPPSGCGEGCKAKETEDDKPENGGKESLAQNFEQQQQDIFELLDSDDEDDVIPDNISRENVNPVDKIRRRVFTPDSEAPGELDMQLAATTTLADNDNYIDNEAPGELDIQLAATSTLTNNDNDNDSEAPGELDLPLAATTTFTNKVGNSLDLERRENTKTERSEVSYFDVQKKKIEKLLLSDDEDSSSEEESEGRDAQGEDSNFIEDEATASLEQLQHEQEKNKDQGDKKEQKDCSGNQTQSVKAEPAESNLNSLLHSTLNGMSPVKIEDNVKTEGLLEVEEDVFNMIINLDEDSDCDSDPEEPSELETSVDTELQVQNTSDACEVQGIAENASPMEVESVDVSTAVQDDIEDPELEADPLAMDDDKSKVKEGEMHSKVGREAENRRGQQQNIADKYKGQYDDVNLVEQFKARNYCRLCYENPGGNEDDLRRHEEEAHQDEKESLSREFFSVADLVYRCGRCPHIPGYLTENLLNQHKEKVHKQRISTGKQICKICNEELSTSRCLKTHMTLKHSEERNYQCNLCHKSYKLKVHLNNHKVSAHSGERNHECNICQKKFKLKEYLRLHLKSKHENNFDHQCNLCYKKFNLKSYAKFHMKSAHKGDEKYYFREIDESELQHSCIICGLMFLNENILHYHNRTKHQKLNLEGKFTQAGNGKLSCQICGKIMKQGSMHNHMNIKHSNDFQHQCNLCYKKFSIKAHAKYHMKKVHKDDEEYFYRKIDEAELHHSCQVCNLKFLNEGILNYHKRRAHNSRAYKKQNIKLKPVNVNLECSLCYTSYTRIKDLRQHQHIFHKGDTSLLHRKIEPHELKFKCQTCEKVFVREHILQHHIKTRHPELSVRYCKLCRIIVRCSIDIHKSKIHGDSTEEKEITPDMLKFNCSLCDKKFSTENSVIYHKIVKHRDLKGAFCELCQIRFKHGKCTDRSLRQHLDAVHTADELKVMGQKESYGTLPCNTCGKKFLTKNILKYHTKFNHTEDKTGDIQCQICEENFPYSKGRGQLMKAHMQKRHNMKGKLSGETVVNFMRIFNDMSSQ